MTKQSDLEKALTDAGYTRSRREANRATELALSDMSATFTEVDLLRKLRQNGYANAADMAKMLYPLNREERQRRRDPSYMSPEAVQKLADATAGLRRTLDRINGPASKPAFTAEARNRCILTLRKNYPISKVEAGELLDGILQNEGPDAWRQLIGGEG